MAPVPRTADVRGIPTKFIHEPGPGTGRPIVFIPGFGMSMDCWSEQIAHFSRRQPVFSYNWRGMGGTGGTGTEYLVNDLATDLYVLLRQLRIEDPILCGHSLGGMIAISYAVTYVESYSALLLVDTSLTSWRQAFSGAAGFGMLGLTRLIAKLFHKPEKDILAQMAPQFIKQAYSPEFLQRNPAFLQQAVATFIAGNSLRGVDLGFMAMATRQPVAPALHCIAKPTALVWGQRDKVFTREDMERMRTAFVTDSWTCTPPRRLPVDPPPLHEIPDAGHCSFQEQPAAFNDFVDGFLLTHGLTTTRATAPA
jgi:pimeloyl-ACP methyl ester carboxylesterase